jgi:CBS domain containing-hemolysin-like protein
MSIRSENPEDPKRAGDGARPSIFERLRVMLGIAPASVREDIEDALEEAAGDVTPHERALLKNVLSLHELRVADAMIPRADIIALPHDASLRAALGVFREAGHSRLPVYADTLDDPRGMLHIRDFINLLASSIGVDDAEATASSENKTEVTPIDFDAPIGGMNLLKPVLFVPRSMPALDLLIRMQATRTHLALVIDEYGGTDGLVSIEDIIEEIVGDIADEHDEADVIVKQDGDGVIADARMDLDDFKAQTGHDLEVADSEQDIDSLGGLVTSLLGRVPQRGEIVAHPNGYEFQVLEADPRRVRRLRVKLPPKPE